MTDRPIQPPPTPATMITVADVEACREAARHLTFLAGACAAHQVPDVDSVLLRANQLTSLAIRLDKALGAEP